MAHGENADVSDQRTLACVDAASRIIANNLKDFIILSPDRTSNKLNTAKAVRALATLIRAELGRISP